MTRSERRRAAASRVRAPGLAACVVGGLVCAGGTALALARGADGVTVVVVDLLGAAAGTLVLLLPRRWSLPAYLVALVLGAGLLARVDRAAISAWFGALLLGLVLGLQLLWNRQQRSAPPGGSSRWGLRLVVDDGPDEVETTDATPDEVRAAFDALDGRGRTALSVFRGSARLDVAGAADGPLVVLQCDATDHPRPAWWVLAADPGPPARSQVAIRVLGLDARLPAGSVTEPAFASAALEVFVRTGGRAPDLPWRADPDVDDLRGPFERWV